MSPDSDREVTPQQVLEDRTRPSGCVLANETTHGSSSSNLDLQMDLMVKLPKPPHKKIAEDMECDLQALANRKTLVIIQSLKHCLSQYYTLEEMKTEMCATMEQYYTSLFVDDELGDKAYLELSVRCETGRRDEADKEAIAKESVHVAVKNLEVALESTSLTNKTIREGIESMIFCLSNYYTVEMMLEHITAMTSLTSTQAKRLFERHIGKNEGTREAYLGLASRKHHAEEEVAQPQAHTMVKNMILAIVNELKVKLEEGDHDKAAISSGIHELEKQAAAEVAKADGLVAETISGLECDMQALANRKTLVIIQSLKRCLSQYYTLEEMKTAMCATVEQYYTSLFVDDELGHEAYLEHSLRCETARKHEAEEESSKVEPLSQSDEEAMAKELVSPVISELEAGIKITDDERHRSEFECLVTCLKSFYTLEEMQSYMSSRTEFKAPAVEKFYKCQLAQRDEVAHEAYVAVSRRFESIRALQQQTSSATASTSDAGDARGKKFTRRKKQER